MHVSVFGPSRVPLLRISDAISLASVPSAPRCWKDYDGERCEIHSLGSKGNEGDRTELAQTFLVIIAVVLSVISCLAILLMTCAQ